MFSRSSTNREWGGRLIGALIPLNPHPDRGAGAMNPKPTIADD